MRNIRTECLGSGSDNRTRESGHLERGATEVSTKPGGTIIRRES